MHGQESNNWAWWGFTWILHLLQSVLCVFLHGHVAIHIDATTTLCQLRFQTVDAIAALLNYSRHKSGIYWFFNCWSIQFIASVPVLALFFGFHTQPNRCMLFKFIAAFRPFDMKIQFLFKKIHEICMKWIQ